MVMQSRQFMLRLIVLAVILILAAMAFSLLVVKATDNTQSFHYHSESTDYRFAGSIPSGWESDIEDAAADWDADTDVGLTKRTTGNTSVYKGSFPGIYSCSDSALACAFGTATGNHITWAEYMYNEDFNWYTDCSQYDVGTVARHEFGHYAGWLLGTITDSDAVMYTSYNGCHTSLDQHDLDSMEEQYSGSH